MISHLVEKRILRTALGFNYIEQRPVIFTIYFLKLSSNSGVSKQRPWAKYNLQATFLNKFIRTQPCPFVNVLSLASKLQCLEMNH